MESPETSSTRPSDELLRRILSPKPRIAIVGASANSDRPSHGVMLGLLEAGYDVVPVNPNATEILGRRCFADLASIPQRVRIVDVFRRREHLAAVAREAVAIRAGVLWLQLGLADPEAEAIARAGGLDVIADRCLWIEHRRLFG